MHKQPWQARTEVAPAAPMIIPGLIWQALYARGIRTADDVQRCLQPSLRDLRSPFLLKNMNKAADRMVLAFLAQEPLCIYADFDLDGTSGLALLKTGLELLGYTKVRGYQPRRLAEGYGVHAAAVREIAEDGTKLLVTVDVGTTAHEALAEALKLNMDVIVTDHHLPDGHLPPAFALVNPNQGDCNSDLGHLAGVGVAFYLLLAVRAKLREQGLGNTDFDPKELLDFLVIGTLTDMVPLKAENRSLVRHGLKQLANTRRPGLRALLDQLELSGRDLTSQDVAIKFSPKLNALSRLESAIRPIDMFMVTDFAEAQKMAQTVLVCNEQRVQIQRLAEAKARAQAELQLNRSCFFVWSEEFHRGVVGLVATRLAQEFGRPVFVGAVDETGRIVGSARLPGKGEMSLVAALDSASPQLLRFGGHAQAAGFETDLPRAQALGEALDQYFSHVTPSEKPLYYDGEGELGEVTAELMRWQEGLEPFGSEFEVPLYRLNGARIRRVNELRGGHLKLELESAATRERSSAIWFSPPAEAIEQVKEAGQQTYELLAEPQWNYFQGAKKLQLLLKGLRPSL